MAKIVAQEKAITLRAHGTSIAEIAKRLQVSKSTVSYWCRDIALSPAAQQRIIARSTQRSARGILAYTESLRRQRQERVEADTLAGALRLGPLSSRDMY